MVKAFILGNPRSGTSLLRLMLNAHPAIGAPPECGFLQWWHSTYAGWNATMGKSPETISGFVSDLLTSRKIETWELDRRKLEQLLVQEEPDSYESLTTLVYLFWARKQGREAQAIVDKNNYYVKHLDELESIWPNARYIFVVRDGRDVACSYQEVADLRTASPYKPNLPVRIEEIALEWVTNNRNIMNFLASKPQTDFMIVRFEDLINEPQQVLGRIVSIILEQPFHERMLEYYHHNDEPSSTLDWKKKTLERPDPAAIGRFISRLEREDIARFEQIAGQMLNRFGYATIG